jgi:hypothetical protein
MKNVAIILLIGLAWTANAADWPREVQSSLGLITIYQPQLGSYTGNALKARAAISLTRTEMAEPLFGAVWLDCRVATDRPNRTVKLEDVSVRRIRFPNGADQDTAKIADVLEAEIPRWEVTFSLDELLESLETAQKEKENARELDVTPPRIIFRDHPAVLVLIDGDPVITAVEGTPLKRVVNTPYFLAQEPSTRLFYLKGGTIWYSAANIMGPWRPIDSAPARVADLAQQMNADLETAGDAGTPDVSSTTGKIPEIVVSTEPAELIATDGVIAFTPIDGTGLLYVSNTSGRLFLEVATQHYYILASGRWFTATALAGPWSFVASNQLPADFANIPPGSECDDVLASVSGTLPAKEAILDAQIPQTAEVDRIGTTSNVQYDGDPQFEPIESTEMSYAVNSSTPVILFGGRYYDCDQGVWFEGASADGPWTVCISVPPELYTIPPQYPVYYVRYVRVYGYTPTLVYTGYTAGYTGCYIYNGTVVYGTGFHYRPWYRHHYYPRPWTWGFGIHYDPWTGWSMGRSRAWWRPQGWFAYNMGTSRVGWWGPAGYRPLYHPAAGPVYRAGYHPAHRPVTWTAPAPPPTKGAKRKSDESRGGTVYDRWASGVRRPTVKPVPPPAESKDKPAPRVETPAEARRIEKPKEAPKEPPKERRDEVPITKSDGRPAPEPVARPVVKEIERSTRQQEVVKEAPPVPLPTPRENNVYADPSGNILRKTEQTWEVRTQDSWKPAPVPPPNTEVVRDAQVRQRSAERVSSFTAPPPPPPPPQPAPPAPKPQPPQPKRPAEKKDR